MEVFAEILGQERAVELLSTASVRDRIAPAYLFVGPAGIGKRLAADSFAGALLASGDVAIAPERLSSHPDFIRLQPTYREQGKLLTAVEATAVGLKRKAPPQIRIEQIRSLARMFAQPPLTAPRAVAVVEEAQTMAEAPANALLKTLEEPGRATIILLAPSADALLPTLVSRCQSIPFQRLSATDMASVLRRCGRADILEQPTLLAIAQGSPGDALQGDKQLQSVSPDLLQAAIELPHRAAGPQAIAAALDLAKAIASALDVPAQLWLTDYLMHCYWQQVLEGTTAQSSLAHLEDARKALLAYAQPRLVWEVLLMQLATAAVPCAPA
ncbi:DNA polymerase III, gamma/tau subunit [Rubidibacter lacunae KORDI 51-2]|uniref:DNA polymerase III, gamma/tau subunit n=1 Tax=Rubidibacter lacunae KORDI 51-2 TaxID=582515 RepID=U5DSS4_9CHRO|nr:DNA polymerase III, gamma/tau subunit [Rubidibacter lacunae]ERN42740.1 DNA polymerase III, gamma/tau subunit [Rubidibacter lacunae KORDI 51-2]